MYQPLLNTHQVTTIRSIIDQHAVFTNDTSNLVSGDRKIAELHIDLFPDLILILNETFPNFKIQPLLRIYIHNFGQIKPHKDVSAFNNATKTMIIYLNESCDGGELYLTINSKTISYSPNIGYVIVFNKHITHWTTELYSSKIFMVLDLIDDA